MTASPLFPHQLSGVHRLAASMPTYLGFDMGIGKSRTFIEAVKVRKPRRVLILCPASAVLVWKREIGLWHPAASFVVVRHTKDLIAPVTYLIVTHGLLSQRNGPVAETLALGPRFEMTAIDEAHAFNATASLRVKALIRAAPKLGDITPLSGTPMRNHAGDLFTLLSICWPAGLQTHSKACMTRYDFEEIFCRVVMKNFGSPHLVRVIEGSKNLPQLKAMIAPFMVRVRKADVMKDLPPILWDQIPVPLDPSLMAPADLDRLGRLVGDVTGVADLTSALSPGNVHGGQLMTLRRMLGIAKLRGATEYLVDMLDNLPSNRKLLVFAVHTHVIGALSRHLGEYSPAVIVGTTGQKDREIAVDKFLNDPACRVFIGNIQAAGTAITLVGPNCKCSDVVFVESSWTPADNAQAACRVHRIGQKDGVVARMLSAAGTVDDLINDLLVRKAREFTQLFDQGEKT